jgi:Secretion system C-terminal sorting domain
MRIHLLALISLFTATFAHAHGHLVPCKVPVTTEDLSYLEKDIDVFPNPNTGIFFLKINTLDAPDVQNVKIFDTKGRLVFQQKYIGATVEVSGLAKGVDVLKIGFEKGQVSRKVIVL